jgi:hypothetical protein
MFFKVNSLNFGYIILKCKVLPQDKGTLYR